MTNPEDTGTKQGPGSEATQFKAGQSGNPRGRPKGARSKLGEKFLEDLYADWSEHGPDVVATVRAEKPEQYMKILAQILPKDINVNMNNMDDVTDDELIERIREIDAAIRPFLASEREAGTDDGVTTQTTH